MRTLAGFFCGLLFGLGLIVSEMTNPARVRGFLDWFGDWDPTLAFVMAGALSVTIPAFALLQKRGRPLLAEEFVLPTRQDIDGNLIAGAAMFGVGWGIAGLCPGPAITALGTLQSPILAFVMAMLAGMYVHTLWARSRARQ